jgi:hypothetical protein
MGPLTSEHRPAIQSIKLVALMAATIIYVITHLTGSLRVHSKLAEKSRSSSAFDTLALILTLAMPWARGRPRRGADWYAADSRRKRHKRFEWALLLAKKRRRWATIVMRSPPRTFIEEISNMELK